MISIRYTVVLVLLFLSASGSLAQTWTKEQSTPYGGTDASFSFSIGDKVYFGGGSDVKLFYEYDPSTGKWTKKANVPGTVDRAFAVAFTIGNYGFVGLGQTGGGGDQTTVSNDFWAYSPASNTWTRIADFPGVRRDGALAFVVNGIAYVGGGSDSVYEDLGDLYSYDPGANDWTEESGLPQTTTKYLPSAVFAATFVIDNKAYIATGLWDTTEKNTLYLYDDATAQWVPKAPFPGAPRQTAVGFAIGGKGYVGLGMSGYDTVYNDFYSYDPVKDSWAASSIFGGKGRGWATAVATSNKAFVAGGWDLVGNFDADFWEFDTAAPASSVAQLQPAQLALSVAPNPFSTSTIISVQAPTAGSLRIEIDDLLGRVAYESKGTSLAAGEKRTLQFDANRLNLTSGVYYLKATIGNTVASRQLMYLR